MILVTGATGFIGKHLVNELAKKQKIRIVSRQKIKAQKNIELFVGDIAEKEFAEKAMKGCKAIIHLAASMKHSNLQESFKANVIATENLVKAAQKNNVKKFVFISSDAVMQRYKDEYGKTKAQAEKIVREFKNHVILRPSVVYGEQDNKNLTVLARIVKSWPVVVIVGSGNGRLQPLYVKDLVKYLINSLELSIIGTYIVAGPDKITFNDLAKKILEHSDMKKPIIHIPLWLVLPINTMISRFFPFSLSNAQLLNLEANRTYDISRAVKKLKHSSSQLDKHLSSLFN